MTFGASFSVKYCAELQMAWPEVLETLLDQVGVRRFRLMSYWDLIESTPGIYDFSDLDYQFNQINKRGGSVTLAIGIRQPRWPECHIPEWATKLPKKEQELALCKFITEVVKRYRAHPALISWQLENEALNRSFGLCSDYSRDRLRSEFRLVKALDSIHPILMSLSNNWGMPFRKPIGDIIGFSLYLYQHRDGKYTTSVIPAWFHRIRSRIIQIIWNRPVVIHELQAEPWGAEATHTLPSETRRRLMNDERLGRIIVYALATNLRYADLWGSEWWVKEKPAQPKIWQYIRTIYRH